MCVFEDCQAYVTLWCSGSMHGSACNCCSVWCICNGVPPLPIKQLKRYAAISVLAAVEGRIWEVVCALADAQTHGYIVPATEFL
jgi:hypothetical protein